MLLKSFIILLTCCVVLGHRKCPKLVADFSQINCTDRSESSRSNESFYYVFDETLCIPKCVEYSESIYKECSSDGKCMPGYFCDQRCSPRGELKQHTCEKDNDCLGHDTSKSVKCSFYCVAEKTESCMAYHINTQDYKNSFWTAQGFKPACNNDGTWQAKQCKGGLSGRCMCFDKNGTRIFGEALYQDAGNMTCACSRRKAELLASGNPFYVSFHCDSMGNYEKLQCDQLSKQCWCVDPKTGDLTAPVVPEKAMKLLPCYAKVNIGSQYMRQCESKKFAQAAIKQLLMTHGAKFISSDFLLCDDDGGFGAYTLSGGIAYCTWRDNSKLGTWQTNTEAGISNLNCHCARDFKKYEHGQICLANGNYQASQNVEGKSWYCVDEDGFSKSGVYNSSNLECSKYY